MKKTCLSFLSLLFVPVLLFAACGKNGDDSSGTNPPEKPRVSWDGMVVKNFADYAAIGAAKAEVDYTTAKATAVRYATEVQSPRTECNRLVGIKANGEAEELFFVDKRGQTFGQDWELSAFNAFGNFTFFSFRPDWFDETELMDKNGRFFREGFGVSSENRLSANYQNENYILDNKTGKIFGVLNILDALIPTQDKAALREQASGSYVDEQCSLGYYLEQSNYSYLAIEFENEGLNERYGGYYQLGATERDLKVRQVLSYSKFMDFFNIGTELQNPHNAYVDIYGNIFANLKDNKYLTPYVLKQKTAKVSSLQKYNADPEKLYMAMNHIMYYIGDDGVQCFDENGELVPSKFTPPTNLYCDESMFVDSVGLTDFYRQYLTVHQFTFLLGNKFFYRRVELEVGDEKIDGEPIYANGKFYFLARRHLFYCDLLTGKKTEFVSDCQFENLKLGYDGKLYFTGFNESLDEIYGIIHADDRVEIDVKEKESALHIIYVKPLN